jgi:putative transposase
MTAARFDPQKNHRRSIRLKGYDYTQTRTYFVTICTWQRACLFGDVVEGEMRLSPLGQLVHEEWMRSIDIRKEIRLYADEFVIMPNHVHGIVWIVGADGNRHLFQLIRGMRTAATRITRQAFQDQTGRWR